MVLGFGKSVFHEKLFSAWDSFTIWLQIFRTIIKIQMTMTWMNRNRKNEGSLMFLLPHPRKKPTNEHSGFFHTNKNSDQLKGPNLLHIFQQSRRLNDLNSSQKSSSPTNLFLPFWNFSSFYILLSIKCSDSLF